MSLLTGEAKMLRETVRQFVDREYPPAKAREIDEADRFPREVMERLAALDLTGLTVPEEYGGTGRDIETAVMVCEELARRSLALAWVFVMGAFFGGENIRHLGNSEQRQRFLPRLARGEIVFAYALTEPNAGSDTASVQTSARDDGEQLAVSGTKIFISGANHAEYLLTLVRTNREMAKHRGLSMLIIDGNSPGVSMRSMKKLGVHGSDNCEITFDNVRVPYDNVLGGRECLDRGWSQLLSTLDVEHIHIAGEGVGVAQGALEEALRFVKQRHQFDQPLSKFQAIQHSLADMLASVLAARSLTYDVAAMLQNEQPCAMETAAAKYFATEVAKRVALESLQLHGGYGYMMEFDIQRYVRDALVLTIGGGTSQIQKNLIAKGLKL